jgi:hypothetical protein
LRLSRITGEIDSRGSSVFEAARFEAAGFFAAAFEVRFAAGFEVGAAALFTGVSFSLRARVDGARLLDPADSGIDCFLAAMLLLLS